MFQPGETWLLEDGCHSLLCHSGGAVTVQTRKVSCDKQEVPACSNNMPPVRVQKACTCHWECPCKYITRIYAFLLYLWDVTPLMAPPMPSSLPPC